MHGKSIIFLVDATFFHATVVTKNHSKDPQRNGNNHGTDVIYRTALSAGLRLSTSISQYEVEITVFYYLFVYEKSHAIGQSYCHWSIPGDIVGHRSL